MDCSTQAVERKNRIVLEGCVIVWEGCVIVGEGCVIEDKDVAAAHSIVEGELIADKVEVNFPAAFDRFVDMYGCCFQTGTAFDIFVLASIHVLW